MQALFTAYATAVKKSVEDDSGGENLSWLEFHDADSFPGFSVPLTALAPRTGLRRVGTARNKSAIDKGGASEESLSAAEVSLLRRKSQESNKRLILRLWDTYWMKSPLPSAVKEPSLPISSKLTTPLLRSLTIWGWRTISEGRQ